MTFLTPYVEHGFSRWYIVFSDYAKIIEPESLKHQIKSILEKAISKL